MIIITFESEIRLVIRTKGVFAQGTRACLGPAHGDGRVCVRPRRGYTTNKTHNQKAFWIRGRVIFLGPAHGDECVCERPRRDYATNQNQSKTRKERNAGINE